MEESKDTATKTTTKSPVTSSTTKSPRGEKSEKHREKEVEGMTGTAEEKKYAILKDFNIEVKVGVG